MMSNKIGPGTSLFPAFSFMGKIDILIWFFWVKFEVGFLCPLMLFYGIKTILKPPFWFIAHQEKRKEKSGTAEVTGRSLGFDLEFWDLRYLRLLLVLIH